MPMPASLKQSLQEAMQQPLKASLKKKMLQVCHTKIAQKGDNVGLSFYAFFANKNHDPERLMEAATWWIQTYQLDHFEKAHRIISMLEAEA
jgi:hypothetical protein